MFTYLHIKNFTIVTDLELEVKNGMIAITGETGAGKSVMLDALDYCLGARADIKVIRHNCDRSDITAHFDVSKIPSAQKWLREHQLESQNECILRRTISTDGRSRSYINGHTVPLHLTRELGTQLVTIYGQHENHSLLKRDAQRHMLDEFAGHKALLNEVKRIYQTWKDYQDELKKLRSTQKEQSRLDLLRYQIEELDTLNLAEDELPQLIVEHKQLAHAEELLDHSQQIIRLTQNNEEASALMNLHQAVRLLDTIKDIAPQLNTAHELFSNAIIEIEEASHEVQQYLDNIELNPERLQQVEERLQKIHDIARKHHINSEELSAYHQTLIEQVQQLEGYEQHIIHLEEQSQQLEKDYLQTATELTKSRKKAATKFSKKITTLIQQLGMPAGKFTVHFQGSENTKPAPQGIDIIEFIISTNPGQPLHALSKVASGGELSRIALAIQVVTAQTEAIPTLLFDEVDVGIGGGTAERVGKLLRELGEHAQLICVTHQPQVACQAHHHLCVIKHVDNNTIHTEIKTLTSIAQINEIARMLGGIKLTQQTVAHAKEMLESM